MIKLIYKFVFILMFFPLHSFAQQEIKVMLFNIRLDVASETDPYDQKYPSDHLPILATIIIK